MPERISVYCSGPLFSPEERETMASIDAALTGAGFTTFLPQRDGLEPVFMPFMNSPLNTSAFGLNKLADRSVFRYDLYRLVHTCDVLVMNVNGRVPDEGAAVEAGIAFALGKPVVLYKNDVRTVFNGLDNAMLSGLSPLEPARTIPEIPAKVKAVMQAVQAANATWRFDVKSLSPHLIAEAEKGQSSAKVIRALAPGNSAIEPG